MGHVSKFKPLLLKYSFTISINNPNQIRLYFIQLCKTVPKNSVLSLWRTDARLNTVREPNINSIENAFSYIFLIRFLNVTKPVLETFHHSDSKPGSLTQKLAAVEYLQYCRY